MIFFITTAIILILLCVNIVVHGTGCWGLQPGGQYSFLLFGLQAIVSTIALFWMLFELMVGHGKLRLLVFGIAALLTFLTIIAYVCTGWQMGTSIHNQGLENLPTFLLASSIGIVVGGYKWWLRGNYKDITEDS